MKEPNGGLFIIDDMTRHYPIITSNYVIRGEPKDFNITTGLGEMLLQKLKEHSRSAFLVDSQSGKELTALEVLQEAVSWAETLRGMGVREGDTVAICSENRLEVPPVIIAILLVGATCAPISPLYSIHELKNTIEISRPSLIFCSPLSASKVEQVQRDLQFLRKKIDLNIDKPCKRVNIATFQATPVDFRNSVAVVLCSSGTTGLPKCVELTDYNISLFIDSIGDPNVSGDLSKESILGLNPFFHGYGFGTLLLAAAKNITVIVMSKFQEELFLSNLQKYKMSILYTVPPLVVLLSKNPLVDRYDLSSLKNIRCGAAPLSKEVQLAVQKKLNVKINQVYGMTELSIACVYSPMEGDKIGSTGLVTAGMDCKVVDIDTGVALPPYKQGELCFKGPHVMKGYRNNKNATDETIDQDGWLHTGDNAYYDEDGFIFIVDRLKELIKYKGFQVPPAELEAILLTHPSVMDAAVIGIPDEEAGELPFAFIVRQANAQISVSEIQQFVAGRVSPQKRLSGGVQFVNEIPKNLTGKILRRHLRTLFEVNKDPRF